MIRDDHGQENALTRVPTGHKRERERKLILKWIDLRTTRREGGRVRTEEYAAYYKHRM